MLSGISHSKWLVATVMVLPIWPYPGRFTPIVLTSRCAVMGGAFLAGPRLGPVPPPPRPRALPCWPLGFPRGGVIGIWVGVWGGHCSSWRVWKWVALGLGERKEGEGTNWFYRLWINYSTAPATQYRCVELVSSVHHSVPAT